MIVKSITVPTPTRIKKFIKNKATKERILIYSLIGAGMGIIAVSKTPEKGFVIGALLYCGITYEVLEKSEHIINDPMWIEAMMNSRYRGCYMPIGY